MADVKVNYEDERFKEVESQKDAALNENKNLYEGMIGASDKFYQDQINALEDYKNTQQQIQQDNTNFLIEKVEQQKAQAEKDYKKEQSGAYVDWQKQSGQYGANAEQQAAQGLVNTGFSESAQVSMYNAYQSRVGLARQSFEQARLDYDNDIKEAMLQNNAAMAEIAFNTLQQKLELSLECFQYKNELLLAQSDKKLQIEQIYDNKWQNVLQQINTERDFSMREQSLAEEIRQFNAQLELQKEEMTREQERYAQELALKQQQLEEEKRQFNEQLALEKAAAARSRGSSGGSSGGYAEIDSGGSNTNQSVSEYGVFSNGYQPKGVSGHGKVSKTGETCIVTNKNGKKVEQNVWKTPDGKLWYWDGPTMQYKPFVKSSGSTPKNTKNASSSAASKTGASGTRSSYVTYRTR